MKELDIVLVDRENYFAFSTYLLPQVRKDMEAGKPILAVGASIGEYSLGAAAAERRGDRMQILSLFVDRKTRRQGIGTELLRGLAALFSGTGSPALGADVNYILEDEDHGGVAAFLDRMGFSTLTRTTRVFSVDTADLHGLPLIGTAFSTTYQEDPHVKPFSALTPGQWQEMEEGSVPTFLRPSAMQHRILRQVSTGWVEDGTVLAWLIACQSFDGEVLLSAAYRREDAPGDCFPKLLRASANRCYLTLGRDFQVYICTINDRAGQLVERIANGTQKEYINYGASTGEEPPEWLKGE